MAKICFVVPVYNVAAEYLKKCISSLVGQTYNNIEIIIVDDGSSLECRKVCDSFTEQDSRIKVLHHVKNLGLPSARNTGIEAANSEWITFIDGDDWVEPNMAEELYFELEKSDVDVVLYSGFRDYANKEIKCAFSFEDGYCFDTNEKKEALEKSFLFRQDNSSIKNSFPVQSACIRIVAKRLFDHGLRFIDVKFAEDALFHLHSTELANKIKYLQRNFYHYRDTPKSMVNSYRNHADQEQKNIIIQMWSFANQYSKGESFKRGISLVAFSAMQMCIWQKFYHPDCRLSRIERNKQVHELFDNYPFKDTLNKVDFFKLRSNQKIKYVLLRLKLYRALVVLRRINSWMLANN